MNDNMSRPITGPAAGRQSVEITQHLPARLESGSDETPGVFTEVDKYLDPESSLHTRCTQEDRRILLIDHG